MKYYTVRGSAGQPFAVWVVFLSMLAIAACNRPAQERSVPLAEPQASQSSSTSAAGSVSQTPADSIVQPGVDPQTGESVGPAAPEFTRTTMKGNDLSLSDLKGKVVVVNFWATWCPPCREEIPDFIKLQKEFKDSGVVFVGVSEDEDGWDAVRPYAQKIGMNYPVVLDDGSLAERYNAGYELPVTFLINRKGQVVAFLPGMINAQVLHPMLSDLVKEKET
ncbi:MAG TPA: TlpA disulfide reductase family protein [Rhodothermales bacterium]|nr:TlpA disulfide reductase family protein [Rhodothermales bacterium]